MGKKQIQMIVRTKISTIRHTKPRCTIKKKKNNTEVTQLSFALLEFPNPIRKL